MKKILLVTRPIAPPWDEASKNFAYYLAKNLNSLEVNLMTKGILPGLPQNVKQNPIYTSSTGDFGLEQKMRSLFFQWRARGKFDVNHYFFTPTRLNSFFIKYLLGSKKTKSIQTVATLREDLWTDDDIKKIIYADLIITYSDYAKDKLNRLGFENVKRIYPGIDLNRNKNTGKPAAIANLHNNLPAENLLSGNSFIINFTGEYSRLGAINIVVDSFIEISKQIPEAILALAVRIKNEKDAAKKKQVIENLKSNHVLEKVLFFDNGKYDMPDIYNLCDVSLFPVSNMNGKFDIPLAVVEAMACEKPVILSDLPILSELTNGRNSVIIEKGNAEQLSAAILDLYKDPNKREAIGKEARKFVDERFDIRNIAGIYQEIYETI